VLIQGNFSVVALASAHTSAAANLTVVAMALMHAGTDYLSLLMHSIDSRGSLDHSSSAISSNDLIRVTIYQSIVTIYVF